ncbi:MAG TPA: SDR family oxidoreductase [Verrucomicrobiae bacterium]
MKVLVVGCGYVGIALGAELVRQGHEVFGLRRSRNAEQETRAAGIVPVFGNITERATLDTLPTTFDWVVDCVSATGGGAEDYRRVYVEGAQNLVDWLRGSHLKKLVYTSSTGLYGQDDGSRVDETSVTAPGTATGRVLVQAEQWFLDAARHGFPAVVLRVAGIYGPGRGYWLKQFLAGEARIEGKGARVLNMIHRDDVVGAVIAALQRGRPGEVYNVVDDEPVSQLDMFEWLAAKLGRSLPPSRSEDSKANRKRGVTSKIVSNRRLRTELAYQLKYLTFREGFAAEIERTQPSA